MRAAFLESGWYAVFDVSEQERDISKACGYIYAPLLDEPSIKFPDAKDTPTPYVQTELTSKDTVVQNTPAPSAHTRLKQKLEHQPEQKEEEFTPSSLDAKLKGLKYTVLQHEIYVPGQDVHDLAYCQAQFDKQKLTEFWTRKATLYGTRF